MAEQQSYGGKPRARRRWRLALALLCLASIWLAYQGCVARNQRLVVQAIRDLGGEVIYDYEAKNDLIGMPVSPPGPEWLRDIVGDDWFRSVHYVRLQGKAVTNDSLPCLERLSHLRAILLINTSVTDLSFLRRLPELEVLEVYRSPVSDDGLRVLPELRSLHLLDLSETHITDEGLRFVGRLPNLQVLRVNRTRITNAGLRHLRDLHALYIVEAEGTAATAEAIRELNRSAQQ